MKRSRVAASSILLLSFVMSCRINLPVVEMARAKLAITQANELKADKYAPELLQEAEKHLYASHDLGIKDDISNCKKEALLAFKYANDAINKALPLLAADTLDGAKALYSEAEKLYAEKFAQDEFTVAGEKIADAGTKLEAMDYRASYGASKHAFDAAGTAKEKSLQQAPMIKQTSENLGRDRDSLMSMPEKDKVLPELDKAGESLTKALAAVDALELKTAYLENEEAARQIDQAKNKITRFSTKDRIASTRNEIQTLKAERGAEFAGEDIEVAESSLNEAETLLEQERLGDTVLKINDADDALARAKGKTSKGIAGEKIQFAENLLEKTKSRDTAGAYGVEIGKAGTLIGEGKELFSEQSYGPSIVKADEAVNLLNGLSIMGEMYSGDKTGEFSAMDTGKSYVVRYNKQMPDCLWRIAQRTYNNARLWPLIYMANKSIIRDPDLIFPGQRFQIPPIPEQKSMADPQKQKQTIQRIDEASTDTVDVLNRKEPDKAEPQTIE